MSIVPPYCGHTYIGCQCQRAVQVGPVLTTKFLKSPHRCPVCRGRGLVVGGFYSRLPSTQAETCRSCQGSGIVWQPE